MRAVLRDGTGGTADAGPTVDDNGMPVELDPGVIDPNRPGSGDEPFNERWIEDMTGGGQDEPRTPPARPARPATPPKPVETEPVN